MINQERRQVHINKPPAESRWLLLILLGLVLLGALGWVNYSFSAQNPGGNDFLVYYTAARALLHEGESPYSDRVAARIQEQVYGGPAAEGQHQLRFVYPLYSMVLFAPFAVISNFAAARAVWMTALEAVIFLLALLNLRLSRWKPPFWLKAVYFVFSLTWYHAVRGLINGNAVLVIALLITLFILSVRSERFVLSGIVLALATIKPHLLFLPVFYAMVWAFTKRHWSLIGSFFAALVALTGVSMLFVPEWILQNLGEILKFPEYNPALTLGEILGGWLPGIREQATWAPTVILGLIMVLEWRSSRDGSFNRFLWTFCFTLVISQWIGIPTDPGNFIILFPALVIVLSAWTKRWKEYGNLAAGSALAILWGGIWWIFLSTVEMDYQPIQSMIMFIPLPAFLFLGLYWVKYWITAPVQQILD
jgi:hypothetical protein